MQRAAVIDRSDLPRILLIGFGDPRNGDDGLGPAAAARIAALRLVGVRCEAAFKMSVEDAALFAEHDRVLLVYGSGAAVAPYEHWQALPEEPDADSERAASPAALLSRCEAHFNVRPRASVLAIRGYAFRRVEGLSAGAQENLEAALVFIRSLINTWREHGGPATPPV